MNDEDIIKINEELKEKLNFMRWFSIMTFIFAIIVAGMLVFYVNTNNSSINGLSRSIDGLTNISRVVVDEIAIIKPVVADQAQYNWDNDYRLENLFQQHILEWYRKNGLQDYNWLTGLDCKNRKTYVRMIPWRVYNDALIFEVRDLSGEFKTMRQNKNKELECFQGGDTISCQELLCNVGDDINETG